mmetsp:Transcript_58058/g.136339  ORF Transcript_58058/g.136339 Transcript_58058/m.136339 type:complete len:239 (+) Transcript_58058:17-733(+)
MWWFAQRVLLHSCKNLILSLLVFELCARITYSAPLDGTKVHSQPSRKVYFPQPRVPSPRRGQQHACLRLRGGKFSVRDGGGAEEEAFTQADQWELNRYAGLMHRRGELKEEIKEVQTELDGCRDGEDEILMSGPDGPPSFQFRWGDTFNDWNAEEATELLGMRIESLESHLAGMEEDLVAVREKMEAIRVQLKAKFGGAVALESDSEAGDEEEDEEEDEDGMAPPELVASRSESGSEL